MARKKREIPSLWERSEYEVLSETETETEKIGIIRNTYTGAIIKCRIPKHTVEEEQKIADNFTIAATQVAYSGQDISRFKRMKIIL